MTKRERSQLRENAREYIERVAALGTDQPVPRKDLDRAVERVYRISKKYADARSQAKLKGVNGQSEILL